MHARTRRARPRLLAGALLVCTLAACGPATPEVTPEPVADEVEVFTWWASGTEKLALDAAAAVFAEQHPQTVFADAAIGGGAGSAAKDLLWSRLAAGDPPDTFQVHGGAELAEHVANHDLRPLDDVLDEIGLAAVLPAAVLDSIRVDGDTYAIPSNLHRANVLWANTDVLRDAGLEPTAAFDSLDDWLVALDAVDATQVTPLVLGSAWTQVHLLEQLLIAHLGPEGYRGLWDGRTDAGSPEVTAALEDFERLLAYTNDDRDSLDWEDAAFRVANGEAAFLVMGDWSLPAFRSAGASIGSDVVWAPSPGTSGVIDLVVDAFAVPTEAPHVGGALQWVATIASAQGQTALSAAKGSIPARSDTSLQALHPYQQQTVAALRRDELVPSLAHGGAADTATLDAVTAAVGAFTTGTTAVAELQAALVHALTSR